MERHELIKAMSKPMFRSYIQARELATLEARKASGKLYTEYENAQIQWYKENKERTEKIQDNYRAHMELIQAQIKALYETQELYRERKDKAMDEINTECWEALAPIREAQAENNAKINQEINRIEAEVGAKYEAKIAKLREKQSA